ncbi:MAG: methionine--tRNA ligase [Gammaproteobacteria bacterium]
MRKILVTTALPYANGPLHLGHILEHIQADIWVRWQKMRGNSCLLLGGDDAHGTPIMLSAQEKNLPPEEWIASVYGEHRKDLEDFLIGYDNYYTTHSEENRELTTDIYEKLKSAGAIFSKTIEQAYDPVKEMFLPDRFIKGTCPRCKAENQYGDSCEVCGATYAPSELINPVSSLSGKAPILKSSEHYFFDLEKQTEFLIQWTSESKHLQSAISHKLEEWFTQGLKAWDISRDAPYFGFQLPDHPDKYFYVWLDAPIGYLASLQNLTKKRPDLSFSAYWDEKSDAEVYHFVGKDIIYFHALFWPAVLKVANLRTPTSIFTHGFVTVNGQKMSKSRGTFITARHYLEKFNPEYLRYYFAAKLSDGIDDIDLNFTDFASRVNGDLVGKVVNIASRSAAFINKHFQNRLASNLSKPDLFQIFIENGEKISKCYEERKYSEAVREIMALADLANQYIDAEKPWALSKDATQIPKVQEVTTMGLNLFRLLILYLKPILPSLAEQSEAFLQIPSLTWQDRSIPLLNHEIATFKPLMQRIAPADIASFQ